MESLPILFILFWLAASIFVAAAASERGRSGVGMFFVALLLSPLFGFLFVIALPDLNREKAAQERHLELLRCLERQAPK